MMVLLLACSSPTSPTDVNGCPVLSAARYSESTSPESTTSPMFPDRPIHPLPKRRLRERLSPEVADSIEYPPTPPTSVFYYPYKEEDPDVCNGNHCSNGATQNGEEEDPSRVRRSQAVPRSAPSIRSIPFRLAQKQDPVYSSYSQLPHSTASSIDGYDTFENTNNKKKRKVPDTALGHSLNDLGTGQSSPSTPVRVVHQDGCDASCSAYHSMGSGSPGLSGPGRGRFGRNRTGRSPLSESNRNNRMRPSMRWSPLSAPSTGIISNAISKVDKHPPSHQGQENVSLLDLQRSSKSSPGSGQFTFTCESQVPGSASWPGSHGRTPNGTPIPPRHDVSGNSSRPPWPSGVPAGHHSGPVPPNSRAMPGPPPGAQPPPPRPRRRRTKAGEYAKAAQDRQNQKQHEKCRGVHDEEHWLCLFCEYEDIFGEKPMALIRSYEKKDRQRRKDEAERRRLLEKAKARGRKGKKTVAGKGTGTGKGSHDPGHDYHAHGAHEPVVGGRSHNHDHHTCGQHPSHHHHHHHHHHCSVSHSVHCDDPNHHHEYEDEHDYHGHHEYDDHYDDLASPEGEGNDTLDTKSSDSQDGHLHKRVAAGGGAAGPPGHARPPDMASAAVASRNGPPPVRV
ncbi:hypothetical protein M0657_007130 [Pyricularia oryzae]|nr:hypothetical protein M9X92_006856 [Pyricularia oryzae]KAI7919354.1 hypothetical protein M0657_007130 [Pyricularia oryzae]